MERYFRSLFFEDEGLRPRVDGILFPTLSDEQMVWLERPCKEKEIK